MVIQGKDDMGGVLEMFDWGISWEDLIPNEEDEVQEGPELDCSAVTGALGVFIQPEAEGEAQLDQVRFMSGFGVGGGGRRAFSRLTGGSLMP